MASGDESERSFMDRLKSTEEDLMTGVSYMIPFVTVGGIFLAVAFGVGNTEQVFQNTGSLGWFLAQIGVAGLTLMVPVLGAYIAYAIADRPGLAPGFILSYILQQGNVLQAAGKAIGVSTGQVGPAGAGYLGALVAGLAAGYVAKWIKNMDFPETLKPMMPILIIPIGTTAILAPVMLLVVGVPVAVANTALTAWLQTIGTGQAVFLGAVIGLMMAFDMGGPVNKVAYVFGVGLISQGIYEPMAAVMIAGMSPPLGMAISNFVAPQKYPKEMYEQAKAAVVLSASFITEGAIPYAAADPFRVIPSLMVGSATAAASSMYLGLTMPAPHGGIFVIPLAGGLGGTLMSAAAFIGCIVLGGIVTAAMVTYLKPDKREAEGEGIQKWT
ncbi:MAG: PTS fructose transporter subunit IIC [Candidatus Nanohaloarchaea archaeon]|nr:PTS fructose transporter subunit IIC [Candidatus Nanohaloarchaea archaeon]